jgi:pimeloyl-ACP methyl ester carboxylesterase
MLPPILCVHGAPESHEIFLPYCDLLSRNGTRQVYLLSFPSEQSKNTPTMKDMVLQTVWLEFSKQLDEFAQAHKKFSIFAHDFGSAWCWTWIRSSEKNAACIHSVFSVSCGPKFRYDLYEHGVFNALTWCYSTILSISYYVPFLPIADWMLRLFSGYKGKQRVSYKSLCTFPDYF